MNTIFSIFWVLVLLATTVGIAVVTGRLIRNDRPTTPPGAAYDWRSDQLRWSRLRTG